MTQMLEFLDNWLQSKYAVQFSSVQSLSCVWLFATPWIAAHQASLSITNSWSSLKLTFIELVMPSSHLILCFPLLLLSPIPRRSKVFSNESTLRMRWPKYWNFSFSIIPSKEIPGLISFRMQYLDAISKMTEWSLFLSKAKHSTSQWSKSISQPPMPKKLKLNGCVEICKTFQN